MTALWVLIAGSLVLRALGLLGVEALASWQDAARGAVAMMFTFTGVSHFTPMRRDFEAMVPPWIAWPAQAVVLTGVAEIAGSVGILLPQTRRFAGICLVVLLVALLPANVHAARRGITLRGRSPTPLWMRVPLQLLFAAAVLWVAVL